ncbi:MAG: hypothetical protein K8S94_04570 [Planctomycetia bacterium]|nr:hypothetical protein [Planctomycetia bacterium]
MPEDVPNNAVPSEGRFLAKTCEWTVCVGVLVLTAVIWCVAYGKFSPSSWALPTTYVDPVYSDFLATAGLVKAISEGYWMPFGWKKVPQLAAPDVANWGGFPTTDEVVFLVCGLLARLCGLFTGFNLALLFGHLAAAATFYFVATRWLRATPAWSFVGGLAFGLAPYLFAESPHHINCVYAWHVPLFPIVWTEVASGQGLQWRSRSWWQALAIAFVTGLFFPYYTFVFCQLTLLGGAVAAWKQRARTALLSAAAVVAAAAAGFFVCNLDTLTYRMAHESGDGPIVAERQYKWMDIYGFKLVDMFIPSFTHHSETLAKFGIAHRQASVLNDEEGCAYLGMLGICCLLALVAAAAKALLNDNLAAVPIQAWWVLWIVLFFNTGGLNSLLAAFTGLTLFRTACRYSVVILVIALLYGVQRLSQWHRDATGRTPADLLRVGTLTAAISACLVVIWDQVPRAPAAEQTALIAKLVDSDRAFVGKLQAALPDKAMVFQFPVMDGTPLPGIPSSDHYRPYLYSSSLHWSSGALPGSATLQWQQAVQQTLVAGASIDQQSKQVKFDLGSVRQAVEAMRSKGFAAIYVNRNGFPDRGKGLFDALVELGYETPPIYSPAGDLACLILSDRRAE